MSVTIRLILTRNIARPDHPTRRNLLHRQAPKESQKQHRVTKM